MAPSAGETVPPGPENGGRHAYAQPDGTAHVDNAGSEPPAGRDGSTADPLAATPPSADDHSGATLTWWRRLVAALADHAPPTLRGARWRLSGSAAASLAVGLALAVLAAFVVAGRGGPELISPDVDAAATPSAVTAEPTAPGAGSPTVTPDNTVVVVHVAGLVATPGVFELPLGSRVVDALEAAGGANAGVDLSLLNLARVLVDGEQIAVGVPAAPDGSGAAPTGEPSAGQPVDLNTATEADLDALPGVGPVLAGRIVAWREQHGAFTAVEELLEVSGIGTATFAELAGLVRV